MIVKELSLVIDGKRIFVANIEGPADVVVKFLKGLIDVACEGEE